MSGDGDVGDADEEVEIDFHTPQLVTFGLAHRLTPKLTVSLQARWSDYPEFEKGEFEFQNFPMLNQPFVSGARSTFRYGAGLEYAVAPWADLWLGVSREEWMIEEKSLSPLLYDTTDVLIGFGTGISRGRWTIRLVGGVASVEDRVATADSNPRFPGRYQLEGGVAGLGIRYLFSP
jgi:long-subunit fatty acid transport protein